MLYQCQKCLKYYDHKYNYLKHINRKTDCKIKIVNTLINISKASNELPKASNELPKASNIVTLPLSKKLTSDYNLYNVETDIKKTYINNNDKKQNYKCLICYKICPNSGGLSKHKKKYHPNYDNELIESNINITITKKDFNDINKKN